jgi:hypothetical protein
MIDKTKLKSELLGLRRANLNEFNAGYTEGIMDAIGKIDSIPDDSPFLSKTDILDILKQVDDLLDRDRHTHSGDYRGGWDDCMTFLEKAINIYEAERNVADEKENR